ncbi:hypothetical protein [Chromohalobacter japonicus]|uniref:hypothetical protein n=1 Tax=Chromohalobacter japonicus TaxID=223900 RepID=UPI001FF446C1|nr:hypothetical protein [Chromohalobacter japonicus]MCK0752106.1 hypothetical protein [Chromohalobacter japonicus]
MSADSVPMGTKVGAQLEPEQLLDCLVDVRAVGVDPLAVALLDHLDAAVADVVGDPVDRG